MYNLYVYFPSVSSMAFLVSGRPFNPSNIVFLFVRDNMRF